MGSLGVLPGPTVGVLPPSILLVESGRLTNVEEDQRNLKYVEEGRIGRRRLEKVGRLENVEGPCALRSCHRWMFVLDTTRLSQNSDLDLEYEYDLDLRLRPRSEIH